MATAPKNEQVGFVLQLNPNDIEIGERVGIFWPIWAEALGNLIDAKGQRTPISVRKNGPNARMPWTLVTGRHRLEGVKLKGLRAIDAIEVFGDADELLDIQASENMDRRDLAPIERACHIRAMADVAEARVNGQHAGLSPQQIAVRARWDAEKAKAPGVVREDDLNDAEAAYTADNMSVVYGWSDEIAAALGLTERTVFRDLALHRALIAPFPDLYEGLARHPIVGENASALRDIASIRDVATRRDLIEALIDTPDMTLAQAKEGLGLSSTAPPAATGATKYMNGVTSNLARLSASQQVSIASSIAEQMKPTALQALRAALDARIAAEAPAPVEEKPVPAVPLRQSVKPDYIACLECGQREVQMKRHLRSVHGLQPGQYIAKWGLPLDYPLVAPNYAEERRQQAKKIGLGGAK
jgi:predicted transcriptional regulator